MRLRLLAPAAALVVTSMLLTGCMKTDPVANSSESEAKTVTVTSEFGKVDLPAEPKRALGMYTTDVDILITLGFPLAEQQPIRGDGYTDFPWFFPQAELEAVKPFANYPDYNYEKILAAQPDFILNGLGYDEKVVKKLPTIAPTYSVDAFDGRSWTEHFEETAKALGRTAQYDAWVAKYDAGVAEVKAAIGEQAKGKVVAPFGYWEGKVNSSCYSGVECQAFRDLGLTIYPGAKKKNGEGVAFSAEQVGQMSGVDVAFAIKSPGEKGQQEFDKTINQLSKNKLFADLPFMVNDKLVTYDMEMTYGSPSGQMAFLDVVEEAFTQ